MSQSGIELREDVKLREHAHRTTRPRAAQDLSSICNENHENAIVMHEAFRLKSQNMTSRDITGNRTYNTNTHRRTKILIVNQGYLCRI